MIRAANTGDANSIACIISTVWREAYRGVIDEDFLKNRTPEKVKHNLNNVLNNKTEDFYVYEEDGIVKGFIAGRINMDKYDSEVTRLYVGLEYQGRNIGTELLEYMKKYYKSRDCKNIIIWTIKNLKNNTFYVKNKGKVEEEKELEIGGKKYPGIGFLFIL